MDIKTKPLNEWSIKEITNLLQQNIKDISHLVEIYPNILQIYLSKLGFESSNSQLRNINEVFVQEIKRIIEYSGETISFDENGYIIDKDKNVLLSIKDDKHTKEKEVHIKLGSYSFTCTKMLLESGFIALAVKKNYVKSSDKLTPLFCDSHYLSEMAINELCPEYPAPNDSLTLKEATIRRFIVDSYDFYVEVDEEYESDFDNSKCSIINRYNLDNNNPRVTKDTFLAFHFSERFVNNPFRFYNRGVYIKLLSLIAKVYDGRHDICFTNGYIDYVEQNVNMHLYKGDKNLTVCDRPYSSPSIDNNDFIELQKNLSKDLNHPIHNLILFGKWNSSQNPITRGFAEYIMKEKWKTPIRWDNYL